MDDAQNDQVRIGDVVYKFCGCGGETFCVPIYWITSLRVLVEFTLHLITTEGDMCELCTFSECLEGSQHPHTTSPTSILSLGKQTKVLSCCIYHHREMEEAHN